VNVTHITHTVAVTFWAGYQLFVPEKTTQAALWRSRLSSLEPRQWQAILRAVPGLSVDTRTFMDKVLTENQRRLCS